MNEQEKVKKTKGQGLQDTCIKMHANKLREYTAVETWVRPSGGPNLANPKSDNFAFHCSSKRMFEDLKSLKIIYNIKEERHQDSGR